MRFRRLVSSTEFISFTYSWKIASWLPSISLSFLPIFGFLGIFSLDFWRKRFTAHERYYFLSLLFTRPKRLKTLSIFPFQLLYVWHRYRWTFRGAVELNIENKKFSVVCSSFNLEISRCRSEDYVREFHLRACRKCTTNQIIAFSRCLRRYCRLCLSSLLLKQPKPFTNANLMPKQ